MKEKLKSYGLILLGIAVTAIGIFMFADRIRGRRWLDAGDDPNIIDAL